MEKKKIIFYLKQKIIENLNDLKDNLEKVSMLNNENTAQNCYSDI